MSSHAEFKTSAVGRADDKPKASGNVLPTVVFLALDVADKSQATVLAVLQDARSELRSAVDQSLDFAERMTAGAFRFAKRVVGRVDDASTDVLASAERILVSSLATARETTKTAAALAVAPATSNAA